jgi:hypothetical protein
MRTNNDEDEDEDKDKDEDEDEYKDEDEEGRGRGRGRRRGRGIRGRGRTLVETFAFVSLNEAVVQRVLRKDRDEESLFSCSSTMMRLLTHCN